MSDQSSTNPASRSQADIAVQTYDRRVAYTVGRLRDLADQVEYAARVRNPGDGGSGWVAASADVLHTIAWGFANLNSDLLVSAAEDVVRATYADEHEVVS
jgi:hypothetical protein